jgi:hypothetical protein
MGRNGQVTEEEAKLSGWKGFGVEIFPAALFSCYKHFWVLALNCDEIVISVPLL